MFFTPIFWLLIALAFVALQFVPVDGVRRRAGVLTLLGVAGIVLVLKLTLFDAGILTIALLCIWLGCRRLTTKAPRDPAGLALIAFAPLLLVWLLGKLAVAFAIPVLQPLLFVGISYLLVKSWSLLKDIVDGKVREVSCVEVAAYLLHLPTFLLGPMHYFGEFQGTLRRPYALTPETLIDIVFRFTLGLFKVYVLAGLLVPTSLLGLAGGQSYSVTEVVRGAVVYSFVLYFDFSGYCDMAIAVSRLLGVDVPENFNWPYLAASMREFWRRWHITFSRALTAHVFVPLTRNLQKRWPHAPAGVAIAGYAGTFLFCGFWHGATVNYLIWGLWHALGFIAQDLWMRYRRSRGFKPALDKPLWHRSIDTAVTFGFISIGWIFFVLNWDQLMRIRI